MARTAYRQLTYRDRIKIEALYNQRQSKQIIATEIGCHISTIYRELQKGYYTKYGRDLEIITAYSADIAQKKHDNNAGAKGTDIKLGRDFKFATFVENKIREGYSPAAVLGLIPESREQFDTHVCAKTLYNYIHRDFFLGISSKDLP